MYKSGVWGEGAIYATDLTKWLRKGNALKDVEQFNAHENDEGIGELFQQLLRHIPGYGLTNKDIEDKTTDAKGPSVLGCISSISKTWKEVDSHITHNNVLCGSEYIKRRLSPSWTPSNINSLYKHCIQFLRNYP